MVKECASSKKPKRLFMESLLTASYKATGSYTLLLETIMLASLSSIRSKVEECIDGPVKSPTFMRDSSRQENVMVGALFGGRMAVGTKEISRTVCNVDKVYSTGRVVARSTKAAGRMECSTARGFSSSTMESDMKVTSRKISSMVMVCSIKMTLSFMEYGRIMSCL